MVKSFNGPKERLHNVERHITTAIVKVTAFILFFILPEHVKNFTIISNIEIVLVREATNNNMKNRVDQNMPPVIFIKIEGKTSKTSCGPAAGC